MRKIIYKTSILLILLSLAINSFFMVLVNADSVAGLNCPSSVTTGENFSVSLSFPSDAYGGYAVVKVTFPDGSTETKNIAYISGMSDYSNSVSFVAKGSGTAKVSVTGIRIVRSDESEIEKNGSKEASITIKAKVTPSPTPTPSKTPTPSPTPTPKNTPTPSPTSSVTYKDVNETVYTNAKSNIRKSDSTSSSILTTVNENTELKRTGIGSNGWSKIVYNGTTGYILSSLVNTEKPEEPKVTFETVNEKMYAKQNCNIRSGYSTDTNKAGALTKGEEVTRIGIGSNGWSKIKYDGKELYVLTSLLSKEKPADDEDEVESNEEETNTVANEIVDEGSETANDELEKIKEEVGVLPEVGRNPAIIAYYVISALSLVIVLAIIYKNKREN